MLKLILLLNLILSVLGRNPGFFDEGMDFGNSGFQDPSKDPVANLAAYEQRFNEQFQKRDSYKSSLRARGRNYAYGAYHGPSTQDDTRFGPSNADHYPPAVLPKLGPSPGMAGYWAEDEISKDADKIEKQSQSVEAVPEVIKLSQTPAPAPRTTQNDFYNSLPKEDDFKAPIRWVSFTSNDTRDGLAKVTDPKTGRNREYVINGTVLVPVIDYRVERLGLTTSSPPVLTTVNSTLRTVVRSIDMKNIDKTDWLVLETAVDTRQRELQCVGDGCQSRCYSLGCDSFCDGDTCATGCVGSSCKSTCKGPGCMSMCIGTGCTATCNGMSCEARCRGNGCEAICRSFSCTHVTNGRMRYGGGVWEDHYPQYSQQRPREYHEY